MTYVALLRGINVGGKNKVEMKLLKEIFESSGFNEVSTYINSGNIIFNSTKTFNYVNQKAKEILNANFDFEIPTLIKTKTEIQEIANIIPTNWSNNSIEKTNVAYLFPNIDNIEIINRLGIQRELVDIKYIKGALVWNIKVENYNKSKIDRIIVDPMYKFMTIRNVNTARKLAHIV